MFLFAHFPTHHKHIFGSFLIGKHEETGEFLLKFMRSSVGGDGACLLWQNRIGGIVHRGAFTTHLASREPDGRIGLVLEIEGTEQGINHRNVYLPYIDLLGFEMQGIGPGHSGKGHYGYGDQI